MTLLQYIQLNAKLEEALIALTVRNWIALQYLNVIKPPQLKLVIQLKYENEMLQLDRVVDISTRSLSINHQHFKRDMSIPALTAPSKGYYSFCVFEHRHKTISALIQIGYA